MRVGFAVFEGVRIADTAVLPNVEGFHKHSAGLPVAAFTAVQPGIGRPSCKNFTVPDSFTAAETY